MSGALSYTLFAKSHGHHIESQDITISDKCGMAGATIGQVETFDVSQESITAYLEQVEQFLVANAVPAEWQVPIFLMFAGRQTYTLLQDLSPVKPADQTLKHLMDTLRGHYEPKKIGKLSWLNVQVSSAQAGTGGDGGRF